MERLGFTFGADAEYKSFPPFCSYCKIIGHILSTCKNFPQSDGTNQQFKSKQHYVPKSTLDTKEENVNLHNRTDNVDLTGVNDPKPSSPRGVVVASNISD